MTRKVCVLIGLLAAFCLSLAAESTVVNIGGIRIEIPQPEGSGPALTKAEIKEYDIFGTDELGVRAVYGEREDVETVSSSKDMPSIYNPVFVAFTITALDRTELDAGQIADVSESMATSFAESMSEDDPDATETSTMLGKFWSADYGSGYAIKVTSTTMVESSIWLIGAVLVKGRMLGLVALQNYMDAATLEALQNTTSDWATQIYLANGGTLASTEPPALPDEAIAPAAPAEAPKPKRDAVFVPYDDPPAIIGNLSPEYPDFAKKARIQGTVLLEVQVYADGTVGDIKVMRSVQAGPGGLDEEAVDAVRRIRFKPGRSNGKPVDTTVIIPIEFKL